MTPSFPLHGEGSCAALEGLPASVSVTNYASLSTAGDTDYEWYINPFSPPVMQCPASVSPHMLAVYYRRQQVTDYDNEVISGYFTGSFSAKASG